MRWRICFIMLLLMACSFAPPARAEITIDTDFPGGNIRNLAIEGDQVRLLPDLRDTRGDWFYWAFRIRGAEGKALTFTFPRMQPVGVRGPAISRDGGQTWTWLGKATPASFTYTFAPNETDIRFSVGMPYTQQNLDAFLKSLPPSEHVKREILCETKKGRKAERLHVGQLNGSPRHRVLLTARHHACEMMASYAMEGIVSSILADDEQGRWFRENVEFLVIPFADKDGVEDGDQGKNRQPRDHNRDYNGESVHRETAALREFVPTWSEGQLLMAIDLHCPTLRGTGNEIIYQVGAEAKEAWAEQVQFGQILEKLRKGPLPYRQQDDYPFGKGWNNAGNYTQGMSVRAWAGSLPGMKMATTFEIPYANASGAEVNAESARSLGRDIAAAIKTYLEQQ